MAGFTTRPTITGTHGAVASGHYLATAAAFRILERGGNAVDAGVAAGFALNVLKPQSNGIAGEAPILIALPRGGSDAVVAINGQGSAPARATIDWFREAGVDPIPGDGLLPITVPASFGSWVTALLRFGTRSLREVLEPAIDLAESGFGMYGELRTSIERNAGKFTTEWPSTAAIYLPDGKIPNLDDRFRQTDWANTFKGVVDSETRNAHLGREAALQAALDYFYRGPIAEAIAQFAQETEVRDASGRSHRGLLQASDMAQFVTHVERPVTVQFRGIDVYKCNTWSQGPVFLQQLTLLEVIDLESLGHNSAAYIHTVIEASKLAYADREAYYGDPAYVDVPLDRLLSKTYAAARRGLIEPNRASNLLRPGDAPATTPRVVVGTPSVYRGDTTHVDVVDEQGMLFAATPSGGWIPTSPVVPSLGFPLGTRGQQFYLDPTHPNRLEPGKRPRTTLTPSIAMQDGRPYIAFGTPGGDQQDQWTLQFFLNHVVFGMPLQEAIDQPTFHSLHFPSSFYPHGAEPGRLVVEGRFSADIVADLRARGHDVVVTGDWVNGQVCAVEIDHDTGLRHSGASPRNMSAYAMGW